MVELFEGEDVIRLLALDEYQESCLDTAIYPHSVVYPAMGLASEAGEVNGLVKKLVRDEGMPLDIDDAEIALSADTRRELAKELGDCLYYIAVLADDIGYTLEEVAVINLGKLQSRMARGRITGSGDNR